jgi:hypothetical protein
MTEPTTSPAEPREILRTGEPVRKPWPEDMFIQGGTRFYSGGERHDECFVEAFPPGTFMRGEGSTVAEAEAKVWAKYQHMLACEAAPEHGPFEARHYTNGSGFCTTCGTWFSKVLPVTTTPEQERESVERFLKMLGDNAPAALGDFIDEVAARSTTPTEGTETR